MSKKGKKVYKNILVVLLVIMVLFTFGGCKKTDEIDERVQAAVETYFVDSDQYSCFLEIETVGASDPSDPVNLTETSYSVIVDKTAKIVRVTLLEIVTYPGNEAGSIDWDDEPTYESIYKSWYMQLDGDTVTVYTPKEDKMSSESFYGYGDYTYEKTVYEDAVLAATLSSIFFPANMDHIKGTFVSSAENSYMNDTLKADTTNRTLSFDLFTQAVESMTGVPAQDISDMDLEVEIYTQTPEESNYPLVVMTIENDEAFYQYLYEAFTGEPYENEFTVKELDYKQHIYINFYEEMLYDEDLELPSCGLSVK